MSELKRLFYGLEVVAPWPKSFPEGRLLDPSHRHITLAFLGNVPWSDSFKKLPQMPLQMGSCGIFDQLLFLPEENHPRVIAYHAQFWEDEEIIETFQGELDHAERSFLPHLTLARAPFDEEKWRKQFSPLPFYLSAFHLYESLGNSRYHPLSSQRFLPPFEEIDHEADIAYIIRGKTMEQLHLHAKAALAFSFPQILPFFSKRLEGNIEGIVIDLNEMVRLADQEIGSPCKAVSFSGKLEREEHFIWEMIIDV